jgi:hypothetical protein
MRLSGVGGICTRSPICWLSIVLLASADGCHEFGVDKGRSRICLDEGTDKWLERPQICCYVNMGEISGIKTYAFSDRGTPVPSRMPFGPLLQSQMPKRAPSIECPFGHTGGREQKGRQPEETMKAY